MSDTEFDRILYLAENTPDALQQKLWEYSKTAGAIKMEQLHFRLESALQQITKVDVMAELVKGITNVMDMVLKNQKEAGVYALSLHKYFGLCVQSYLKKIEKIDKGKKMALCLWMVREGKSLNWLVGNFIRDQLFTHGRVGEEAINATDWLFSDEELDELIEVITSRISTNDVKEEIGEMPNIRSYLYGWRNLNSCLGFRFLSRR